MSIAEYRSTDPKDTSKILQKLRYWSHALDNAIRIPGTEIRFGWDPIIGLVPWLGDAVTGLFSAMIVFHAFRLGIPRIVKTRMLINVFIDVVVGAIPLIGDAFDFAWKANRRNMELLEKYAMTGQPASTGDRLFVAGAGLVFLFVVSVPILLLWLLVKSLPPGLVPGTPHWTSPL
jgi:hypothetical protein